MNRSWIDQLKQYSDPFRNYWGERNPKQRWLIIGTFLFLFIALSLFIFIASRPQLVPLYTGQLTQREVGDIKAELDKQGYTKYQLSDQGTMILVPQKDAPDLLVSLASSGYPKDNKINYDIFSENLSFGATDRQIDILEREAMQNKLAQLLQHVDGIKSAEVILTLPENSVFVRKDQEQSASASVMVEVEPGIQLDQQQIKALYTLVSHSVPKLPIENITIVNQYSETLSLQNEEQTEQSLDKFEEQRKVQQNIEKDIQQSLQSLLGTILGPDKVYVHTFVKVNFDKVKTQENLVEASDDKNNGIVVSSEKVSKSFTGEGADPGGVVGTGPEDVPGYVGGAAGGNSTYDESQERINYEVNRINNEIIKSPYQIEDITINVGVEPNPDTPNMLPPETEANIRNIVSNTVRTALGHPNMTDEEIGQRITVFPHIFAKGTVDEKQSETNMQLYIIAGIAAGVVLMGLLLWLLLRRKKKDKENTQTEFTHQQPLPVKMEEEYFSDKEMGVESQLKRLLEQRPEDFSKVIRTWINEEEG